MPEHTLTIAPAPCPHCNGTGLQALSLADFSKAVLNSIVVIPWTATQQALIAQWQADNGTTIEPLHITDLLGEGIEY